MLTQSAWVGHFTSKGINFVREKVKLKFGSLQRLVTTGHTENIWKQAIFPKYTIVHHCVSTTVS